MHGRLKRDKTEGMKALGTGAFHRVILREFGISVESAWSGFTIDGSVVMRSQRHIVCSYCHTL